MANKILMEEKEKESYTIQSKKKSIAFKKMKTKKKTSLGVDKMVEKDIVGVLIKLCTHETSPMKKHASKDRGTLVLNKN